MLDLAGNMVGVSRKLSTGLDPQAFVRSNHNTEKVIPVLTGLSDELCDCSSVL